MKHLYCCTCIIKVSELKLKFSYFRAKQISMKKINFIVFLSLCGAVLSSCSQSKFIVAPPFTDVEKISKIEIGQTKNDVNKTLGISPYDILYLTGEDYMCYYNYRLLDRKINIDNSNKNRNEGTGATLSSQEGQSKGEPFFSEWRRIYVNFKDGKVTHHTTDAGLEDANYIQLVNGTVKLLNQEDLKLSNFYQYQNEGGGINIRNESTESNSTEAIDLEKILFQLKLNGKFKKTDSPRKKTMRNSSN